jgi:hypothetical protein
MQLFHVVERQSAAGSCSETLLLLVGWAAAGVRGCALAWLNATTPATITRTPQPFRDVFMVPSFSLYILTRLLKLR